MMQDIRICLAASQIRRKNFNGRTHLVLPVVMLTEGVHNGSAGPLFYPVSELQASVPLWNGKPVLVNHPMNGDRPASANSPQTWEGQVLGQIWNTGLDGNRLKAEMWLDEARTRRLAPKLLNMLKKGERIEVSTGIFTADEDSPGVWNGEQYTHIARRHVPDHLAILPDKKGACSWQDGCGIRANDSRESSIEEMLRFYGYKQGGIAMNEEPLALPTLDEKKPIINMETGGEEPLLLPEWR